MDALEEDPFQVEYDEAPIDPTGFRITDDDPEFPLMDQLSWALRKAGQHDKRIDEIKDFAQRETVRILKPVQALLDDNAAWLADSVSGEERERTFFVTKLEDWAVSDRVTHLDKAQQTALPAGKVSTTVRQPAITVEDAEVFVKWYLAVIKQKWPETNDTATDDSRDDIVAWKPKLSMKAIRDASVFVTSAGKVIYTVTGEVVPGLGVSELTITPKVVLT